MKKTLLLTLALAVAGMAAAQRTVKKVSTEKMLVPTELVAKQPGKAVARKTPTIRWTKEKPTAFYVRPDGIFFYGMDYTGSMGNAAYAYAPVNTPMTVKAEVSGESAKWIYSTGIDWETEEYIDAEKEITEADSTLTFSFEDVDWFPAPELLGISKVGESALKAKLDTASYQTAAALVVGGASGDVYVDADRNPYPMPAVNYDPSLYAGAGSLITDFATNSAEADATLAEEFEMPYIHTLGFVEMFPMVEGSKAVINGVDIVVKADVRNIVENEGLADGEDEEGQEEEIAEDLTMDDVQVQILPWTGAGFGAPIGTLNAVDFEVIPSSNGGVWAYGLRFEAELPIITEGTVAVLVLPTNDEAVFSPLAMVTQTDGNNSTCYALCEYQLSEESDVVTDFVGTSFYWAQDRSMQNLSSAIGLLMSYEPEDIAAAEELLSGVSTPVEKKQVKGVAYELTGRRVSAAQKGIVIIDGKIVIR